MCSSHLELHCLLQYLTVEQELKEQFLVHHHPKGLLNNRTDTPRDITNHLLDMLICINSTFCFFYKGEGRCSILVHGC